MDLLSLLWLFFIISSFTPVLQQRLLEVRRRGLIRRIEQHRGSRVISLIHRQETMRLLGIPVARFIDIEDSEEVLRAIRLTPPDVPIDLVLHTPGGLVLAAEQIARALVRHRDPVRVLVPHYAMSGGTLLALAADASAERLSPSDAVRPSAPVPTSNCRRTSRRVPLLRGDIAAPVRGRPCDSFVR